MCWLMSEVVKVSESSATWRRSMESLDKPDYTKYVVRLQSFNDPHQWAGESTVYIKDLVEAGFVYTGCRDLVFCFKCGLTVSNWKEDDNAVVRHQEMSKDCAYLSRRSQQLSLSSQTSDVASPPQNCCRKSLADFVKEAEIYDWLPGKGVVPRSHNNDNDDVCKEDLNRSNCVAITSPAETSLANEQMRFEAERLESFALCPVNKHWPSPEALSSAGFYYTSSKEDMRCFCCGVTVESWESSEQDALKRHRALSPSCSFVSGLHSGNVVTGEKDLELNRKLFDRLCINSNCQTTKDQNHSRNGDSSVQPATPVQVASIQSNLKFVNARSNSPDRHANYVASPNKLPYYPSNLSSLQNNVNPMLPPRYVSRDQDYPTNPLPQQYHISRPQQPQPSLNDITPNLHNIVPNTVTTQNYAQGFNYLNSSRDVSLQSVDPALSYGVSSAGVGRSSSTYRSVSNGTTANSRSVDLSDVNKRLETFFTWPRHAFLQPEELADAGFVYTGKEDGVSCYKCKVLLKQWEHGDTAWLEHERWSPVCPLVIEHLRRTYQHTRHFSDGVLNSQRTNSAASVSFSSVNETYLRRQQLQRHAESFEPNHSTRSLPSDVHSTSSSPDLMTRSVPQSHYNDAFRSSSVDHLSEPVQDLRNPRNPERYYESTQQNGMYQPLAVTNFQQSKKSSEDGKRMATKSDVDSLVAMGFTEDVIYRTINCYVSYARKNFNNLNDMTQAVLYFQEYGHLEGTPFGKNLNIEPSKEGEDMIYKRAKIPNYGIVQTEQNSNRPGSDDRQSCKICMDNDVEVTFVPCGHLIVCESCALGRKECPVCRTQINETVRTYFYGN